MTVVGVISDTHDRVRPEALDALAGVDSIIHAGDICSAHVIEALATLAPVEAVRGNNDKGAFAESLPASRIVRFGDVSIYVIHDLHELDLDPATAKIAAVVSGHSHQPRNEFVDGVLYFNPGSAGPRRFKLPITVGKLTITNHRITGQIIQISV